MVLNFDKQSALPLLLPIIIQTAFGLGSKPDSLAGKVIIASSNSRLVAFLHFSATGLTTKLVKANRLNQDSK